jgi:hypothetical protein
MKMKLTRSGCYVAREKNMILAVSKLHPVEKKYVSMIDLSEEEYVLTAAEVS